MDFQKLSNDEVVTSLEEQFSIERNTSHNILLHLKEIKSRRIYAEMGYSSLFWMLIKYFRQSEASARDRLKALELMMEVPLVEERLISGDLSMSTVSMAQRQIKREEKLTGNQVSKEKKIEIMQSITGKTMAQTEIELFKHLPETASNPQSHERRVSENATRMNLTVPDDVRDMMVRLKEIWAHVDPAMDNVEVMRRAFKLALEKVDPSKRKKTQSATEPVQRRSNKRLTYYGREFDRALWEKSGSRCDYVDPRTGRRCDCKFGLQREHIIPLAMGGTNELSNMQLLCRTHNDLRARQAFGNMKIDAHQLRPSNPAIAKADLRVGG
jgi:hypothetical protein